MSETILVIDDSSSVRAVFRVVLEEAGFRVAEAEDGGPGVEMARRNRPDLVITDIYMPQQEGMATIVALKRLAPATPVIAMSGNLDYAGFDVLDCARKLGADLVLGKPVRPAQLLEAVRTLLSESDPRPA